MIRSARKLLELLSPRERRAAALLLGMVLVMALLDMIGVASVMPFIAVLSNPEVVETNAILAALQDLTGLDDTQDFLWFLGLAAFALLIVSLGFKALTTYVQSKYMLLAEYSLGRRFVESYLRQPYAWFLHRHSADLGKTILSEVTHVIHNGMIPLMNLIAQSAVALALFVLLLLADPVLALTIFGALGLAYLVIYSLMRGFLALIGRERVGANKQRFTAVNEAFAAIKEVKSGGLERYYLDRFSQPAEIYARHSASANIISQLPRFFMEAVAFGGLMLVILALMAREGQFVSALPIIALYAFAGYRLMPALQLVYSGFTQLRFVGPALDVVHEDLRGLRDAPAVPEGDSGSVIRLDQKIELSNVQFAYPETPLSALHGINLEIPARTTVGFVGPTGSGKTTLADVILGLLEPQQGTTAVDGQALTAENRRDWQRSIGYVPQQIHLSDDSVAANIAFGVEPNAVDFEAVVRAAKIASLHEFVGNELPQKYDTVIGEQGVRLSGGQRQRIGIARALYRDPSVLILDEATSALDSLTEQAVIEAVNELRNDITIILIAHRLSTVRFCDEILMLDRGEVIAQGTYAELIRDSDRFRIMAEA